MMLKEPFGRLFRQKKAGQNLIMKMVTELIISALVIMIFVFMFVHIRDDVQFEAEYLSRDVAMLAGLVSASPYTTSISYTQDQADITKFEFDLSENSADLIIDQEEYYFPYYLDDNLQKEISAVSFSDEIVFTNNRQTFYVDRERKGIIRKVCPAVDVMRQKNILVVDPGISGRDASERETDEGYPADEYLLSLARAMQISPANEFDTTIRTRDDHTATIGQRLSLVDPKTDVLVSLETFDSESSGNAVRAYVPSSGNELSHKLACYVLLEIENSLECDFKTEMIFDDSNFRVLRAGNFAAGIVLEIGQYDLDNNCLIANLPQMSSAILRGIDKYYES
jgi:N-acetylmuramoyl-L-alanine amidase